MKKNYKLLNIIILILIVTITPIITVHAERIITATIVSYDNQKSGLSSTNVQTAIDELYAKCGEPLTDVLKRLSSSDTVMADDGTTDHNMRYIGASPNNYVTFSGEEWRIIGVFNNVDDGTGKKEARVKIIKSKSMGNKNWNTGNVNIWKSASLNTELQATVYASNSMVDNAVWYLGDPGGEYAYTASEAYKRERSSTVASGNDATWTGKVGLMYPSDYGLASSACKDGAQSLQSYNATSPDCKGTDWLALGSYEWLLSPRSDLTASSRVLYSIGSIGYSSKVNSSFAVRPVVYLKSSVTCKNCSKSTVGTQSEPFIIG